MTSATAGVIHGRFGRPFGNKALFLADPLPGRPTAAVDPQRHRWSRVAWDEAGNLVATAPSRQFSIAHLFGVTTVFAIALGLGSMAFLSRLRAGRFGASFQAAMQTRMWIRRARGCLEFDGEAMTAVPCALAALVARNRRREGSCWALYAGMPFFVILIPSALWGETGPQGPGIGILLWFCRQPDAVDVPQPVRASPAPVGARVAGSRTGSRSIADTFRDTRHRGEADGIATDAVVSEGRDENP